MNQESQQIDYKSVFNFILKELKLNEGDEFKLKHSDLYVTDCEYKVVNGELSYKDSSENWISLNRTGINVLISSSIMITKTDDEDLFYNCQECGASHYNPEDAMECCHDTLLNADEFEE